MFDWSCPSLSASDSILLPIWHSRHSHFMQRHVPLLSHMHTLFFGLPILYISLRGHFFFGFHCTCLFSPQICFLLIHILPPIGWILFQTYLGVIIQVQMATQILAAKSTQTQIRCPALHPTSVLQRGGTDAHLAHARWSYTHLHALSWSLLRRCGPLGTGGLLV